MTLDGRILANLNMWVKIHNKGDEIMGKRVAEFCKPAMVGLLVFFMSANSMAEEANAVRQVLTRVQAHDFYPLNSDDSFTMDRESNQHGIADPANIDWRVRLLAVRDLARVLACRSRNPASAAR